MFKLNHLEIIVDHVDFNLLEVYTASMVDYMQVDYMQYSFHLLSNNKASKLYIHSKLDSNFLQDFYLEELPLPHQLLQGTFFPIV